MPYIDYYTNLYIIYQQKRIRPSSDWINGYLTILMGGGPDPPSLWDDPKSGYLSKGDSRIQNVKKKKSINLF